MKSVGNVIEKSTASRFYAALSTLILTVAAATVCQGQHQTVQLWGPWEGSFTAPVYVQPEVEFQVDLTSPSGKTRRIDGFWDGGTTWRVRFLSDEVGRWHYRTRSEPSVAGLNGQQGEFECFRGEGTNRFLRHGAVKVSEKGHFFAHADGTPFFWLVDTAWNGVLLSTSEDWDEYLQDRVEKNFTGVQFVITQWRAAYGNAEGEVAYLGFDQIRINPEFFVRMDARIDALNERGLLAVPVLLWTLGDPWHNPGQLAEDQAVRLARYLIARYQGNHVAWILPGDGRYFDENAERWKRIGRAVFGDTEHAPATLHPQGMQWPFDVFLDEGWVDFFGYQSGHGDNARALEWIHSGPASEKWKLKPVRPVINLETPYENHIAYHSRQPHSAYNVRRAVYWSLLSTPTAGVSYGAHGIWSWPTSPQVPLNHARTGVAPPWHEAMTYPGSLQMKFMAEFFGSIPWWELHPDHSLLAVQPGKDDPARYVTAARSQTGNLVVLYLPVGGPVRLNRERFPENLEAQWFDPGSGQRVAAHAEGPGLFKAPDEQDWVLLLRSQKR